VSEYTILKDGKVVPVADVLEWGRWFEDFENRRVAKTEVGGIEISTVFLGINHNFGSGRPLWFETMVFGGALDQEMDRYTTLEEAVLGHERLVAQVQGMAAKGAAGGHEEIE